MTLRIKGATTIKGLTSVNWSPNLLFAAGEQGVWYDPSDFSTMFQDTAGTTPVTATGQSVARINDKSGNGNNATQSTAANRPTLQIDGNGKYYLSFDGSNDILFCNDTNMPTGDLSVFWGSYLNVDFPAAFPAVASYGVASPSRSVFILYGNPSNIYVSQYGDSLFVSASKTTAYVASLNRIGTAYNLRKNGGAGSASQSMATNTAVYGANGFGLGGSGAGLPGVSPFLSGRIYGLIIRGAASTASQISMTETYMNSKTAAY